MSTTNDIKKKKCSYCLKKIGPLEFTCTCEKVFCTACRLPEIHKCTNPKKEQVKLIDIRHEKKIENYNLIQ